MGRGGGDLSQDYTEPLISFHPLQTHLDGCGVRGGYMDDGYTNIYGQIIGQRTIWKFSRMNRKRNEEEKLAIIAILGQ